VIFGRCYPVKHFFSSSKWGQGPKKLEKKTKKSGVRSFFATHRWLWQVKNVQQQNAAANRWSRQVSHSGCLIPFPLSLMSIIIHIVGFNCMKSA